MKFSESWLRSWVNPSVDTETLLHQLTMSGLEVEGTEPVAPPLDNVVVGEVLELEQHPDADKLRVCKVNVGEKDHLQIICGAANVARGMKVVTAMIGAKLPGDLKIKKAKLRGVESFGMLCSAVEIGMAEAAEGILPLASDAPVGTPIVDYFELNDLTIELSLTPNRGDCLSVAGIAREVGTLNHEAVTVPEIVTNKSTIKETFPVKSSEPEACPRYIGRIIKGIDQSAETPMWMQERLRRSGLRSLGPVVDVTNYVLLELGQPMHAFDLAKLEGGINVRFAKAKEKLTTLDGNEVELSDNTLVIADNKKAIAMAGIMGGEATAVTDDTKDIFFESAHFNPLTIAGRARQYGLHTDSSHRFERGVSAELPQQAIERATQLLVGIVGGEVGPLVVEESTSNLPKREPVLLRSIQIERVLGVAFEAKDVEEIFTRLGMDIKADTKNQGWQITPPPQRFDIVLEVDLIEELGRIYGYDNLPESRPVQRTEMNPVIEAKLEMSRIKQFFVDQGFQEAITYSFVDPGWQKTLFPGMAAVTLANPISSDMADMRVSLWPGLLQAVKYNLHRQQDRLCLFECGLRFIKQDDEIQQKMTISGVLTGDLRPEQWAEGSRKVDFFDAKGYVEGLLALTAKMDEFLFKPASHSALHPGQSAEILQLTDNTTKLVGWVGSLHPRIQSKLDLSQAVMMFELDAEIFENARIPQFQALSKFPAIRRDIAVVVDDEISAQQVLDTIRSACSEIVHEYEVFDIYVGEGIDSGRKSVALGLTLQDLSRTLRDDEVDEEINRIVTSLTTTLGATLRE